MTEDIVAQRRAFTESVLREVSDVLRIELKAVGSEVLCGGTTIYVTGSAGRGDMGPASDLDPYVIDIDGRATADQSEAIEGALKATLLKLGLPELDADGEYARLVGAASLLSHLGEPLDDEKGALTKRMLLLLESQPLINPEAYEELLGRVIDAYWLNEGRHPDDYLPVVLLNDIVRYWRTLLLNHESRLRKKLREQDVSDARGLALRHYSSYKLRIPRCMSCFSALLYLLALTADEPAHVSREDVVAFVRLQPLGRLEELKRFDPGVSGQVDRLGSLYMGFLERSGRGKTALTDQMERDEGEVKSVKGDGREFTKIVFELVQRFGGGRELHRAIVV